MRRPSVLLFLLLWLAVAGLDATLSRALASHAATYDEALDLIFDARLIERRTLDRGLDLSYVVRATRWRNLLLEAESMIEQLYGARSPRLGSILLMRAQTLTSVALEDADEDMLLEAASALKRAIACDPAGLPGGDAGGGYDFDDDDDKKFVLVASVVLAKLNSGLLRWGRAAIPWPARLKRHELFNNINREVAGDDGWRRSPAARRTADSAPVAPDAEDSAQFTSAIGLGVADVSNTGPWLEPLKSVFAMVRLAWALELVVKLLSKATFEIFLAAVLTIVLSVTGSDTMATSFYVKVASGVVFVAVADAIFFSSFFYRCLFSISGALLGTLFVCTQVLRLDDSTKIYVLLLVCIAYNVILHASIAFSASPINGRLALPLPLVAKCHWHFASQQTFSWFDRIS